MKARTRLMTLGTALSLLAALAGAVAAAGPAAAATTEPCDPHGSTSTDARIARELNSQLTGPMDNAMNAYRVSCARVIAAAVKNRGLSLRAAQIAVTTTVVESTVRNLTYGDRDSIGLFQQRPSQGWGTVAQIMDPEYATGKFLDKMLRVDGGTWATDPIGKVCQDVQVSAFPQAYYNATGDGVAIANAVWNASPTQGNGQSVTGDDFADVVATKPDGSLWLYANNIGRDDGVPFNAGRQIGAGWNAINRLVAADVTGDGYTDLLATKPDGSLWLYANNIVRDNGTPFNAGQQIGAGWNAFDRLVAADVTGDGYTDLVATKPDGTLWLYGNNIVRDNGTPFNAGQQIGAGWNTVNRITGADVTGDGYTDLVGTKPDGSLWLYGNNIVRDDGVPFNSSRQIGAGWNTVNRITGTDVTGDGFADLVATKPDGSLWLYANNIVRDDGVPFNSARQIGAGWNAFDRITA